MPEDVLEGITIGDIPYDDVKQELHDLITEYSKSVISYSKKDVTRLRGYEYRAVLPADLKPFFSRQFRLNHEQDRAAHVIIQEMIRTGVVVPINFPRRTYPFFLVRKNSKEKQQAEILANKGELPQEALKFDSHEEEVLHYKKTWRFILDLRELNKQLIKLMPDNEIKSIHETMGKLRGCERYISLDIREFFLSVPVASETQPYLCFTHRGIHYAHLVSPPGVADLPAFCTAVLHHTLRAELRDMVAKHIDDCAFGVGDSYDEFKRGLKLLRWFFEDMENAGILLSANKMQLFVDQLDFLGFTIQGGLIKTPQSRIDHIMSIPTPRNCIEMAKLLGTTGFISHYIPNYAAYSAFLFPLLNKKGKDFKLKEIHLSIISALKDAILNISGLYFFDPNYALHISVDASYVGGGSVFWQEIAGERRIIKFGSFKFTDTEIRSLSSGTKEALAIVKTLINDKILVQSGCPVIIHTDFKALISVYSFVNVAHNTTLQRWMTLASSICSDLTLVWSKNTNPEMVCADYMSRLELDDFKTKFSLSRERTRVAIDALTQHVEPPDEWKLGNRYITFAELEQYATKVSETPEVASLLEKVKNTSDPDGISEVP